MDSGTGLCTTSYSPTTHDYDAGSLADGTGYLLSSFLAADSINYLCENEQDKKVLKREVICLLVYGGTGNRAIELVRILAFV